MIWFALGVVVYAVMGLFLLALCRAASCADGQVTAVGARSVRGLHERQRVDGLRGRDLRHEDDPTRWHRAG